MDPDSSSRSTFPAIPSDKAAELGANLPYVEALYAEYLANPGSVPEAWHATFSRWSQDPQDAAFRAQPRLEPRRLPMGPFGGHGGGHGGAQGHAGVTGATGGAGGLGEEASLQDKADQMVRAYRVRGHLFARLDPLGTAPTGDIADIEPGYFGISERELDRMVSTTTIRGPDVLSLRQLRERLHHTYCRSIGAQFMHIDNPKVRSWLQDRMEGTENRITLTREQQIRILTRLTDAVLFEEFIQRKYLGAKSFSLEGSESLVPLLDLAIDKAGQQGVGEIVLGMAHRGRLNVLANIMGKTAADIFHEFEDKNPEAYLLGRGDVKYHLGYSSDVVTGTGGRMHLTLCFNPSHLEYVNPVAQGRLRAKLDRRTPESRVDGLCILVHGDAAFAGEGVMQEILNMSELPGYSVGGTLHIILNNQIGFTTSPKDGRSTTYASDVARMLQIPIFHVNGEDPEAVAAVVNLALEFRREFKRDVVIDMYGYRRRGHNEGDEPSFTQPLLYKIIQRRKSVREGYLDHLLKLGGVTREEADRIAARRTEELETAFSAAKKKDYRKSLEGSSRVWIGYVGGPESEVNDVETGLPRERLQDLLQRLTRLPAGFTPHPKIEKVLESRLAMSRGEKPLDWAAAEALAYASLAAQGHRVRISGQDVQRGTFSHRHAVLHDVENGSTYMALGHLDEKQGPVELYNSPLSEIGVLGFEYGYSLDCPNGLIAWEAQFGDFVNVAQVIIDQFIASAEDKWRRLSGLTMLLPHGYEGMGPEHSHARLERFLMLAAQDNLQVCNATTPAQFFHLLRRQVLRPWRKPLVVMTPKSLLRNPRCVSSLEELASGTFARLMDDTVEKPRRKVERVIVCSGKVFYDLEEEREKRNAWDVALLRLEQLYPLQDRTLERALSAYKDAEGRPAPTLWVQEEPENMGAWRYLRARYLEQLPGGHFFGGAYRPASSSPATGSPNSHRLEHQRLMDAAFGTSPKGLFGGWADAMRPRSAQAAGTPSANPTGNQG